MDSFSKFVDSLSRFPVRKEPEDGLVKLPLYPLSYFQPNYSTMLLPESVQKVSRDGFHENTMYYTGSSYTGNFVQKKRHGLGVFTWSNGDYYKGIWFNDVLVQLIQEFTVPGTDNKEEKEEKVASELQSLDEADEKVVFLVRGERFEAARSLFKKHPRSFLNILVNGSFNEATGSSTNGLGKEIHVDLDPTSFAVILEYYSIGFNCLVNSQNCSVSPFFPISTFPRTILKNLQMDQLLKDADYCGLDEFCEQFGTCDQCGILFCFNFPDVPNSDCLPFHKCFNQSVMHFNAVGVSCTNLEVLKGWIVAKIEKPVIKFKLRYQATVNGFDSRCFHHFCDGVNNLLVLVRTKNGVLYGAFSVESFDVNYRNKNSQPAKEDPKSFIYFLECKNKSAPLMIPAITNSYSIPGVISEINRGPAYGVYGAGLDFGISHNPVFELGQLAPRWYSDPAAKVNLSLFPGAKDSCTSEILAFECLSS